MSLKDTIGKTLTTAQQEMMLTLPNRLVLAFKAQEHHKDIDPGTHQPFTSFYRWLWVMPPDGCGLCGSRYLDAGDIIRILEKSRDRMPAENRTTIEALITDLTLGHGAGRGKGGRPKKEEQNRGSATPVSNGEGRHGRSKYKDVLATRLAESTDPRVHAAWEGFLKGQHKTAHAAAVACGLVQSGHDPLVRLKQYWRKATKAARAAFLRWLETEEGEG